MTMRLAAIMVAMVFLVGIPPLPDFTALEH